MRFVKFYIASLIIMLTVSYVYDTARSAYILSQTAPTPTPTVTVLTQEDLDKIMLASQEALTSQLINWIAVSTGNIVQKNLILEQDAHDYAASLVDKGTCSAALDPTYIQRIRVAGYPHLVYAAEILVCGHTTPEAVMNLLLHEPYLTTLIFDPRVTDVGVGYVYSLELRRGRIVMNFAGRGLDESTPTPVIVPIPIVVITPMPVATMPIRDLPYKWYFSVIGEQNNE